MGLRAWLGNEIEIVLFLDWKCSNILCCQLLWKSYKSVWPNRVAASCIVFEVKLALATFQVLRSHISCLVGIVLDSEHLHHHGTFFCWLPLVSHFSRVWLCATPKTAAHQAPPSLGLSRQEHWSGLPFPSPMNESEKWKWSRSVVSNSSRPHGLQPTRLLHPWDFPGKVLEWGAIVFSE